MVGERMNNAVGETNQIRPLWLQRRVLVWTLRKCLGSPRASRMGHHRPLLRTPNASKDTCEY
jgi:hypothetical protein